MLILCVCVCSSLLVLGMRNMQGTLKPMENLCQYLLRAKAPAQTRGHLLKQSTPRRPDSILKVGLLLSPCTHGWTLLTTAGRWRLLTAADCWRLLTTADSWRLLTTADS